MANKAYSNHIRLGFCVTILTTIVGTTIFSTISQDNNGETLTIIVGSLSVSAAILSALQTFLGFSDATNKSKKAAQLYESIYHKIDYLFLQHRLNRKDMPFNPNRVEIINQLKDILRKFEKASKKSPNIPTKILKKFRAMPPSPAQ